MAFQYLLIGLLFVGAALALGRRVWRMFFAPGTAGCAKGCGGSCGTLDVDQLQRTIEARQATGPPR